MSEKDNKGLTVKSYTGLKPSFHLSLTEMVSEGDSGCQTPQLMEATQNVPGSPEEKEVVEIYLEF